MEIDWFSGVPAHEQIATELAQRILDGVYQPGSLLPHRQLLAEEFDVSHATVSKASALLRERRLVVYRPGRGLLVQRDLRLARQPEGPNLV